MTPPEPTRDTARPSLPDPTPTQASGQPGRGGVVEHVSGDLFAQRDVYALAHGVNCRGVMGAGIAVEFKRRWPQMFTAYAQACGTGELTVGGMFAWQVAEDRWVYNLASQDRPGKDARLDAVATSLEAALAHACVHSVPSIALPRIGCGIGGLDWPEVADVLDVVAARYPVVVRTVSRPADTPLPARPGRGER